MSIQSVWQQSFDFFSKPVVVRVSEAELTSDAGLLPFRQLDERIGLSAGFAAALTDLRYQPSVTHTMLEMVRSRTYGILADYPDQNDHDVLRSDPVFKLIADRRPSDDELASQPTLSRFENAIDVKSLRRLQDVFIQQFIASFESPPAVITLDIDPFDDPTHGQQQLTFFHGYYGQYQYLPRVITCAENDQVAMACLLYGSAHPALGAAEDVQYLVQKLRAAFPDVRIILRADSGFGLPSMYDSSEHVQLEYSIGIGMNPKLKERSDALLADCVERFAHTNEPQRKFTAFWYQAGSWRTPRWVVVKCEANAQGTNRRAIVTNRPGAFVLPEAAYDAYADRGESENRNKELKCGLRSDRLSDHRYMANLFRLYLHAAAHNLLVQLRQQIAEPPPEDEPQPEAIESVDGKLTDGKHVPAEALGGKARRRMHNRRRRRDPLGEGQPCTWRTRLIKVGARVTESARRVVVELSASWPYLSHYEQVSEALLAVSSAAHDTS
jgi:hypothetical protein